MVIDLQSAAGNRAVWEMIRDRTPTVQRNDEGGMSSSSGSSTTGSPGPVSSQPTPAQTAGRTAITEALEHFSQAAFRDIPDWSLAAEPERITLIDKATDLSLFWVGPRDEAALERCWASFGAGFQAAVEANPHLWARSIFRGVDPDNVPQTKGRYPTLKSDILGVVKTNVNANEDKVAAEFAQFGMLPPANLLRADSPARKTLDAPAFAVQGPSPTDRLREQSRLAKVVLDYQRWLTDLSQVHVGRDARAFDPGNPTQPHEDLVLFEGMTSWELVNRTWQHVSGEVALILNAWPVLYAASMRGGLQAISEQSYSKAPTDNGLGADPLGASEQVNAGQEQVRELLTNVLQNIGKMRDQLDSGSADALDFTPVHRALWSGKPGPSGQQWSRGVWLPVLNDERQVKEDAEAAIKLGVDLALMVAIMAGTIGTLGGAAIAIGVAGASALRADVKSDRLGQAAGATVADESSLVTKEAVSASAAEAEWQKIQLGFVAVTSALGAGVEAAASQIDAAALREAQNATAAEDSGLAGARQKLRDTGTKPGQPVKQPATPAEPPTTPQPAPKGSGLPAHQVPIAEVTTETKVTDTGLSLELTFDDPSAGTWRIGEVGVSLDEQGVPRATMSLNARATIKGEQVSVRLVDAAGNEVSLTKHAIDEARAQYQAEFGKDIGAFDGQLAKENLRNFRLEYGRARAQLGGDPSAAPSSLDDQAAQIAIRRISFGRHRATAGYGDFEISLGNHVEVNFGGADGVMKVPSTVDIRAHLKPLSVAPAK